MKKILLSVLTIALVATVAIGATQALFSDTEESTGNTFTAGSLDLKVNGQDGTVTNTFSANNMVPGNSYDTGCVILANTGSIDGVLTVEVSNLVSNENGLIEPETSDGDLNGVSSNPDGYLGYTGDGELWNQITTKFCIESGAGSHSTNGVCDWDDTIIKGFSSTQDDYSGTYSIKQNVDLAAGKNIVIPAGETRSFCTGVKFIDDASSSWWGGQGSLTNNMAMSDDAQIDFTFGLIQTN